MDQQQTDIKELLSLYNNAMQIKKRAEKKLIRFTNCLSELDRRNCGAEIIEQINVVRQKIKEERKNQAEQTPDGLKQFNAKTKTSRKGTMYLFHMIEQELESMDLEYKCKLQQQQQVINDLNLQIEEVKDYNQEQIFSLTQKNQQLLNLIEDLNKQIAELKQSIPLNDILVLEHYQNEEFKSQQFNNSSIRVSQNSQMLQNIKKVGSQENNQTTESLDQCQFETLASEVKYQETCENFDEEILLGSSNQCAESKGIHSQYQIVELQSPIRIQDQQSNQNQIYELNFTIEELKEQIQNLQQEKQKLIDSLQENELKFESFKQKILINEKNLHNQINDLIQQNQDLLAKEQILQAQIEDQKNEIKNIAKLTEDLSQSQQLLNQKDLLISTLNGEQEQFKSQIQQFEQQVELIPKLKEDVDHHKNVINEKDGEIQQLKQHLENEQNLNVEKQKTNETLNEKVIETQNTLDKQIQSNSLLQNDNQSLIQKKQLLTNQIEQLNNEKEQQKSEFTSKIQDLETEIQSLSSKRQEQDQHLNEQNLLLQKLSQNESNLTKEVQDLTSQLKEFEIKFKVLEQENTKQSQEIKVLNEQKQQFESQIGEVNSQYQKIKQDFHDYQINKEGVESALNKELECKNYQYQLETKIQNQQLLEEIDQLKKNMEELTRISSSKDLQRDEQIKFQKQLENQYKVLEDKFKNAKQQSQEECDKIAEGYKEELKLMQEQLMRSSENIKQFSPVRELSQDDKYKEQINRLNDELRLSKLQIAQFSAVNNQLKQQQKDLVLKLQSMLKLTPAADQDLNDLILIIESNLSSCQSSPVRQSSKKTSMIDTTKMLMNKSRMSMGSNRGSVLVSQNQISDNGYRNSANLQDNGFRNSINVQKVPSSSQSNTDLQKILDDVSDQDIVQQ
ncbi:unnamed protein product (macronuclear) [Paramecium tetraurelia]|uniref:Uncharacterized protein n=1 Tax=Paramecium tetraurelia TaxID=5888 RepID=A0C226_PARTE|nr:uncharacterized protein GSPATT00034320001 [Paramecium tetraurelia]CAK64843.1 unnamed protein product [Paramecium tetraurelia]|eukprot:XP_001432240.1 hypothetical protein (macronuclear) [Paramecium tetraurelia strain d4-2]